MFVANNVIIICDFSAMGDRNEIVQTFHQIPIRFSLVHENFLVTELLQKSLFFSLKQRSHFIFFKLKFVALICSLQFFHLISFFIVFTKLFSNECG